MVEQGAIAMFTRSYGVELECIAPQNPGGESAAFRATAQLLIAAGIPCEIVPYGAAHRVHTNWKVTHDGSVRQTVGGRPGSGMEVVSPPLTGPEGVEQVKKVCALLHGNGHFVNQTCGMHVHVYVAPMPGDAKARLAVHYARNEKVIDRLLPPSRRGAAAGSGYCRSIAHAETAVIMGETRSMESLAQVLAGAGRRPGYGRRRRRYDSYTTKYVKLNFTPHSSYGTVEFRHHSGTVEAEKAEQWIKFCLRMVARAARASANNDPVEGMVQRRLARMGSGNVRPGTKLAIIVDLLTREEGCTRAEAMAATEWPSISMQANARAAGLELRQTTGLGGVVRYWGARPDAAAAAPETPATVMAPARPTLEGLLESLDMPEADKVYWRGRYAKFAARDGGDDTIVPAA